MPYLSTYHNALCQFRNDKTFAEITQEECAVMLGRGYQVVEPLPLLHRWLNAHNFDFMPISDNEVIVTNMVQDIEGNWLLDHITRDPETRVITSDINGSISNYSSIRNYLGYDDAEF